MKWRILSRIKNQNGGMILMIVFILGSLVSTITLSHLFYALNSYAQQGKIREAINSIIIFEDLAQLARKAFERCKSGAGGSEIPSGSGFCWISGNPSCASLDLDDNGSPDICINPATDVSWHSGDSYKKFVHIDVPLSDQTYSPTSWKTAIDRWIIRINDSLVAGLKKRSSFAQNGTSLDGNQKPLPLGALNTAHAAPGGENIFLPAAPAAGSTNVNLSRPNCAGTASSDVECVKCSGGNQNAQCITISICPLWIGPSCTADQKINQSFAITSY